MALLAIKTAVAQATPEQNLEEMGIILPKLPDPTSNSYVNLVRSGNYVFVSGKGPLTHDSKYVTGKVNRDISLDEAKEAARLCAIHHIAILKQELGNLAGIKKVIKVSGFINSDPDFNDFPAVMDAFSNVFIAVFGEKGKHTRTAIGANSLPFNWVLEVEIVVEVTDSKRRMKEN